MLHFCFICVILSKHKNVQHINALVAQLDRVTGYEPVGRGFESLLAHQRIYALCELAGCVFCCPALLSTSQCRASPCTKGVVKKQRSKSQDFLLLGNLDSFLCQIAKITILAEFLVQQTQRQKNYVFAVLKMWKIFLIYAAFFIAGFFKWNL